MPREPRCEAFVGTTGTGKSTKAKKLIRPGERVLVVTYADNPKIWREYPEVESIDKPIKHYGIRKLTVINYDIKTVFEKVYMNFRNGLIIFDDCRQYIPANIEHRHGLLALVVNHRHIGTDIFFIVHSPNHIPVQARPFIKRVYIFKCTVLIKPSSFQVEDPELFLAVQKEVNKRVREKVQKGGEIYGTFCRLDL